MSNVAVNGGEEEQRRRKWSIYMMVSNEREGYGRRRRMEKQDEYEVVAE